MKKATLIYIIILISLSFSCDSEERTQEQEAQKLELMLSEIKNLSTSTNCDESSEWTFTALGSKACGGPSGYIAYSTKIDTKSFLEKVAKYTSAQEKYNQKWGIISDCASIAPPIGIICENGKPTFKY